jgi:hypothetical protein
MTKVRIGPNCASIGLAHDAFVVVKHSSTFSRLAQPRIAGVLFAARLSKMTNSRYPPGPDRPQRGQGVIAALVPADDTPQLVITYAVTAVEVADAVHAMIGRAQPGGAFARRPAHALAWPDGQRPELVEHVCDYRPGSDPRIGSVFDFCKVTV